MAKSNKINPKTFRRITAIATILAINLCSLTPNVSAALRNLTEAQLGDRVKLAQEGQSVTPEWTVVHFSADPKGPGTRAILISDTIDMNVPFYERSTKAADKLSGFGWNAILAPRWFYAQPPVNAVLSSVEGSETMKHPPTAWDGNPTYLHLREPFAATSLAEAIALPSAPVMAVHLGCPVTVDDRADLCWRGLSQKGSEADKGFGELGVYPNGICNWQGDPDFWTATSDNDGFTWGAKAQFPPPICGAPNILRRYNANDRLAIRLMIIVDTEATLFIGESGLTDAESTDLKTAAGGTGPAPGITVLAQPAVPEGGGPGGNNN
jgi:hypothetical protein